MVDVDVVAVKLAEIADRLERVRLHCPADAETLATDRHALELVSFNPTLAIHGLCRPRASRGRRRPQRPPPRRRHPP